LGFGGALCFIYSIMRLRPSRPSGGPGRVGHIRTDRSARPLARIRPQDARVLVWRRPPAFDTNPRVSGAERSSARSRSVRPMGARYGRGARPGTAACADTCCPCLVMRPSRVLAAAARLFGHRCRARRQIGGPFLEQASVADGGHRGPTRWSGPMPMTRHDALRVAVVLHVRGDLRVAPGDLLVEGLQVLPASQQRTARATPFSSVAPSSSASTKWARNGVDCLAAGTRRTRPAHRAAG